jgi:hypothetical protein
MLGEGMGRWRWRTCRACRGLSSENFLGKTGENPVDLGWRLISPFLGLQIQGTAIWVSIPYDLVGENTVFPIQIAITGGVNHQFSDITIGPYGYGIVVSQVPSWCALDQTRMRTCRDKDDITINDWGLNKLGC